MDQKIYIIKNTQGQIFEVPFEDISGVYNWNGEKMASFSHGHVVDEGYILGIKKNENAVSVATNTENSAISGIDKKVLVVAGLGLAALLFLV